MLPTTARRYTAVVSNNDHLGKQYRVDLTATLHGFRAYWCAHFASRCFKDRLAYSKTETKVHTELQLGRNSLGVHSFVLT